MRYWLLINISTFRSIWWKILLWLIVILCSSVYIFEVSAGSVPEFTIKIGKLQLDGVKDTNIDKNVLLCNLISARIMPEAMARCFQATPDFWDPDYIRFYLSTEDNFDKVFRLQKNHYVFVWTPQDTNGKWNPQIREVSASKPSFGGVGGHTKINGDLTANFITSKRSPASDG